MKSLALASVLALVAHGMSAPQVWEREVAEGRIADDNLGPWGGVNKSFRLIVTEINGFEIDCISLATANREDYERCEKHTGMVVRVSGYNARRGRERWLLVDSIQEKR
jgi:hypothetical protein